MAATVYRGILTQQGKEAFVLGSHGETFFKNDHIWSGYLAHWLNQKVCGRYLPQKEYTTGKPIVLLWPDTPATPTPYMELYYNERLVKYWASSFGHNAINVAGRIYNFSHLLNENEVMTPEEYFYRPALGEFAPSPNNGRFEILANGQAYYDKFGRNFMRSIHVLRVEGIDVQRLATIFQDELDQIHSTPVDPRKPEKYREFNFFNRSCTTIIRDGLIRYGFSGIKGVLPRDFFVNAAARLLALQRKQSLSVQLFIRPQLKVPEAPYSRVTPLFNPYNRFKFRRLPKMA